MLEDVLHYSGEAKTNSLRKREKAKCSEQKYRFYCLLGVSSRTFDKKQKKIRKIRKIRKVVSLQPLLDSSKQQAEKWSNTNSSELQNQRWVSRDFSKSQVASSLCQFCQVKSSQIIPSWEFAAQSQVKSFYKILNINSNRVIFFYSYQVKSQVNDLKKKLLIFNLNNYWILSILSAAALLGLFDEISQAKTSHKTEISGGIMCIIKTNL